MNVLLFRQRFFDLLTVFGLFGITIGLLIFPSQMVSAAKDGVLLCFNVLIPSLFPFFVISSLTVELGLADRLGTLLSPVMKPLFNVGGPCASALILSFIGGYPVGARTVINLYKSGKCSKSEAERMLSFSNNSGPAFIFGVVGAGIFASSAVGLMLYLTHIAASILVGLLFRNYGDKTFPPLSRSVFAKKKPFSQAFVGCVSSAFTSCLGICGFVIFFTVLIKLLFLSGLLGALAGLIGTVFSFAGMDEAWARRLLTGFIELTSGVWSLREVSGSLNASIAMAAFMLGWAGLSIHCQVLSFLTDTGLSARTYITGKLLHAVISAGLAALLTSFVSVDVPVGAYLASQVTDLAGLRFSSALTVSAILAGGVLLVFLLTAFFFSKNSGKSGPGEL